MDDDEMLYFMASTYIEEELLCLDREIVTDHAKLHVDLS